MYLADPGAMDPRTLGLVVCSCFWRSLLRVMSSARFSGQRTMFHTATWL